MLTRRVGIDTGFRSLGELNKDLNPAVSRETYGLIPLYSGTALINNIKKEP